MKHYTINIIFLVSYFILFISCTEFTENEYSLSQSHSSSSLTRAFVNQDDNKVTYDNILTLAKGLNRKIGFELNNEDLVHCIVDETNDTILYACNLIEGGWIVYASDKRVPSIILQSDEGSFFEFVQNHDSDIWIKSMMQEMKNIRIARDEDLNFTEEEIVNNKNFWISISQPDSIFKLLNKTNITRGKPTITDSIIPPNFLVGHYEYYATYRQEVEYDMIDRLIKTDWHEDAPFNDCCPFKSNEIGKRAPAGRAAISAAQMLHFLNSEFGVPPTAPTTAYCNHNVDQKPDWAQTNYSHFIWEKMSEDGKFAAPLIADIGRRCGMIYGNDRSFVNPKNLVSKVFEQYGIKSRYLKYDVEKLKENLLQKIPVIIEARDNYDSIPTTFIVDRYKRLCYKTTNEYRWVYDNVDNNKIVPCVPDSFTYTYSTPYIDQIGINWGFNNHKLNTLEWYPLMGAWRVYDASYNFNQNRKMICIDVSELKRK